MEKEKHCCVCGVEAVVHCGCGNGYCTKHYKTTVNESLIQRKKWWTV